MRVGPFCFFSFFHTGGLILLQFRAQPLKKLQGTEDNQRSKQQGNKKLSFISFGRRHLPRQSQHNLTAEAFFHPSSTYFWLRQSKFRKNCGHPRRGTMWQEVAAADPEHSGGTHAKTQNTWRKWSRKLTKIGKRWAIFKTARLPSCQDVKAQQWQRSPSLKHTPQTKTHTREGTCARSNRTRWALIYFARTLKSMQLSLRAAGWLQKNLIIKAQSCQQLPSKWIPKIPNGVVFTFLFFLYPPQRTHVIRRFSVLVLREAVTDWTDVFAGILGRELPWTCSHETRTSCLWKLKRT